KIRHWFGGDGDEQAGELIFFDAIPTRPVQLKADIMTPHYGDWYARGDEIRDVSGEPEKVPADWHDPVPVPFLVVDKGASFQFAIGKQVDSDIDIKEVLEALTDALQWLGAGAKTAAGYGRMLEDPDAVARRRQEEEKRREAEEAARRQEMERRQKEEAARRQAEEAARRQKELDAMPEYERVLAGAGERIGAIAPGLALRKETYGELRSVINSVLDAAGGWVAPHRVEAAAWVEKTLDEHGWRHPDFKADKRRKWEKKTRQALEKLRRG
ncbi:MAG: type III-B CRISPR module RAMP protein Cmr6, partial [Mariprofundaceae bacterium]|nr:type III-B CRISPR module RAMP protein Cmr6 [Mariprofundaceae bacterium]